MKLLHPLVTDKNHERRKSISDGDKRRKVGQVLLLMVMEDSPMRIDKTTLTSSSRLFISRDTVVTVFDIHHFHFPQTAHKIAGHSSKNWSARRKRREEGTRFIASTSFCCLFVCPFVCVFISVREIKVKLVK